MTLARPRVFIGGYYGFGNTGDEVILRTMVANLREHRPDLEVVVTSATPAETAAAHGVESVLWCSMAGIEAAVAVSDLVIVGGGGLFFDTFGFDPAAFLTDYHTGIGFYTAPAVVAALHRRPVMLYAVGVGPLVTSAGERFTRLACELADVITVRDAASKTVVEGLGISPEKVLLTADPAFAFESSSTTCEETTRPSPALAAAVRPWATGGIPDAWEGEVATALDAFVERTGGSVLFVPFQHLPGRPEDDVAVAHRLRARMASPARVQVLDGTLNLDRAFAALAASDVIVGMRLHSVILGLLARVPVVAIDYEPKVGHLMRRLRLDDQLVPLESLRDDALSRVVERTLTPSAERQQRLDREVTELTRLARQNALHAIRLLEDRARPAPRWSEEALAMLPPGWRERASRP